MHNKNITNIFLYLRLALGWSRASDAIYVPNLFPLEFNIAFLEIINWYKQIYYTSISYTKHVFFVAELRLKLQQLCFVKISRHGVFRRRALDRESLYTTHICNCIYYIYFFYLYLYSLQ